MGRLGAERTDIGMKTSNTFNQDENTMAFKLAAKVGVAPTFRLGFIKADRLVDIRLKNGTLGPLD